MNQQMDSRLKIEDDEFAAPPNGFDPAVPNAATKPVWRKSDDGFGPKDVH
jgi:hypothetical protein